MADDRREDADIQPLEGHIHLVLPGVNKPVVVSFPADKYTTVIIVFLLCATICVASWLIFVIGDKENVAGVFGNKPQAVATGPILPECPPCERPRQESNLHVTDLESAPSPPRTRAEVPEEPSRTKVRASGSESKRQPRAKLPTARPQSDGRERIPQIGFSKD